MTLRTILKASLALALVMAAPAVRAGGFSSTNVQLLQGFNADDDFVTHPKHGNVSTLTFNSFSTWEYGDSFFFADLNRYDYSKSDGGKLYAEWHPRIFLNQLLGQQGVALGFIRNWGLAFEYNQGGGFNAALAGIGFDLQIPGFSVAGLNVFYRYDSHAYGTYQISPYWTVPFSAGPANFIFTGFVDVNGNKDGAGKDIVEIWAQPELLVDVLSLAGGPKGKLHAGIEWWYHRGTAFFFGPSAAGTNIINTSIPQAMVQWTVF